MVAERKTSEECEYVSVNGSDVGCVMESEERAVSAKGSDVMCMSLSLVVGIHCCSVYIFIKLLQFIEQGRTFFYCDVCN